MQESAWWSVVNQNGTTFRVKGYLLLCMQVKHGLLKLSVERLVQHSTVCPVLI
jgi:hypothetical protein